MTFDAPFLLQSIYLAIFCLFGLFRVYIFGGDTGVHSCGDGQEES